jgi:hypothetical protein
MKTCLFLCIVLGLFESSNGKTADNKRVDCVFKDHKSCIDSAECCRVFLNDEFICLDKAQLSKDYQKMLTESYVEQNLDIDDMIKDVDGEEEEDICPKWMEANDLFFSETTIKYSCECSKKIGRLFTGFVILIGILFIN